MPPFLIIVTGLPASGKTSVASVLGNRLLLPFTSKDVFKELLFETLWWSDRAWSKRLDIPSIALLFQFLEGQISKGKSCIIDHWFASADDVQRLADLQFAYNMNLIQVLCYAEGHVLIERFKERSLHGPRHPGHCDHLTFDEHFPILARGRQESLPTSGVLIELDTSNFAAVDFDLLTLDIKKAMEL